MAIAASTDWRSMFDREYIGAWDLPSGGRGVTLTIAKVVRGELQTPGTSKKTRKPVVYFEKTEKGFALNKTNSKTIARLYSNDTREWIGKRIEIYATTTSFGDEQVECIRVRPTIPGNRRPNRPMGAHPTPPPEAPDAPPTSGLPNPQPAGDDHDDPDAGA